MSSEYISSSELPRTNYSQIPNSVLEIPGLTHAAIHLYLYYRSVCWEGGTCYRSTVKIAKACGMNRGTVRAARDGLEGSGLITVVRRHVDGVPRVDITIVDIWQQNADHFAANKGGRNGASGVDDLGPEGGRNGASGVGDLGPVLRQQEYKEENEQRLSDVKTSDPIRSNGNSSNGKGGDSSAQRTKPKKSRSTPSAFHLRAADELHKVVSSHKTVRSYDRDKWADHIRLMESVDNVSTAEIKKAIKWYRHHIGDEYAVEAYTGESFRKKFEKIESAMKRKNGTNRINGNGDTSGIDAVLAKLNGGKS